MRLDGVADLDLEPHSRRRKGAQCGASPFLSYVTDLELRHGLRARSCYLAQAEKSMITWTEYPPYYWSGPDGWTICRVVVGGKDAFELWNGSASSGGRCVERKGSLATAQQAYCDNHARA